LIERMTIHISLLRGVNVGGRTSVAMAALRDMMAELGFADARTLLQSGNVVFRSERLKGAALEHLLEEAARERLGLFTDFIVRTAKEWDTIVAANPFPDEAKSDPGHLVVMALKDAPSAKAVQAVRGAFDGPEIIATKGRQLYIVYPAGIGRSRLTNSLIERKLETRGTGRNWNTVLKLAALVRA
jgi:uncharacterized protein (DUF1697 family)